jgi:hypothetical protein
MFIERKKTHHYLNSVCRMKHVNTKLYYFCCQNGDKQPFSFFLHCIMMIFSSLSKPTIFIAGVITNNLFFLHYIF